MMVTFQDPDDNYVAASTEDFRFTQSKSSVWIWNDESAKY